MLLFLLYFQTSTFYCYLLPFEIKGPPNMNISLPAKNNMKTSGEAIEFGIAVDAGSTLVKKSNTPTEDSIFEITGDAPDT